MLIQDHFLSIRFLRMSHTITIRLTPELAAWLEATSKKSGVPRGRIVREQLESARRAEETKSFMELAGVIEGPASLSRRKGFSTR